MQTARIVECDDVVVQYPNGVRALDHISLTIDRKDLVGLIGPNGAGKTSLLNVILGLIKPDSGAVRLFGEPVSNNNLRRVGYVPQALHSTAVGFPATVFETVLFGRVPRAGLFHRLGKSDDAKADDALRLLEIFDLRNRKLDQLSGGQLQRVFVAKALASDPELLILDEPTSGADVHSRTEFYTLLSKLNRDFGLTVILSSHDVGTVTKMANKVVCINHTLFFCGLRSDFTDDMLAKTYDYQVRVIEHTHS
jgi:zinc transport system ATP-binding protein